MPFNFVRSRPLGPADVAPAANPLPFPVRTAAAIVEDARRLNKHKAMSLADLKAELAQVEFEAIRQPISAAGTGKIMRLWDDARHLRKAIYEREHA